MEVGDNDRQLLFDVVCEGQVTCGESVAGVHAKLVNAVGVAVFVLDVVYRQRAALRCGCFFCVIVCLYVEASSEPVVGHSEKLVVD